MQLTGVGFGCLLPQAPSTTPSRSAFVFRHIGLCFVSEGTYLTNEAKGADDAPDADTAIINAEGNHAHAEEKKEYFI